MGIREDGPVPGRRLWRGGCVPGETGRKRQHLPRRVSGRHSQPLGAAAGPRPPPLRQDRPARPGSPEGRTRGNRYAGPARDGGTGNREDGLIQAERTPAAGGRQGGRHSRRQGPGRPHRCLAGRHRDGP